MTNERGNEGAEQNSFHIYFVARLLFSSCLFFSLLCVVNPNRLNAFTNSCLICVCQPTELQQQHQHQPSNTTALPDRLTSGAMVVTAADLPTCSPRRLYGGDGIVGVQQTMYKCSTLGRKPPAPTTSHFHNHLHHHLGSTGDFMSHTTAASSSSSPLGGGGGGGSVIGIATMRHGQYSGRNELPLIITVPQMEQQQQKSSCSSNNSNVPILNSILSTKSVSQGTAATGGGGNNNILNPSTGNPVSGPGTTGTSTLKKRVQIQEVTV